MVSDDPPAPFRARRRGAPQPPGLRRGGAAGGALTCPARPGPPRGAEAREAGGGSRRGAEAMAAADPPGAGDLSQLVSAGRTPAAGSGGGFLGSLAAGSPALPSEAGRRGAVPAPRPGSLGCSCSPCAAARGSCFLFLSPQAENLLHQLQENFQALTEKISLRNILF